MKKVALEPHGVSEYDGVGVQRDLNTQQGRDPKECVGWALDLRRVDVPALYVGGSALL